MDLARQRVLLSIGDFIMSKEKKKLAGSRSTSLHLVTSQMEPSVTGGTNYGKWRAQDANKLVSSHPADTQLIMQATSILGRRVNLAEAKELFNSLDMVTRQPKTTAVQPSGFAGLLSALRAAFGGK